MLSPYTRAMGCFVDVVRGRYFSLTKARGTKDTKFRGVIILRKRERSNFTTKHVRYIGYFRFRVTLMSYKVIYLSYFFFEVVIAIRQSVIYLGMLLIRCFL